MLGDNTNLWETWIFEQGEINKKIDSKVFRSKDSTANFQTFSQISLAHIWYIFFLKKKHQIKYLIVNKVFVTKAKFREVNLNSLND